MLETAPALAIGGVRKTGRSKITSPQYLDSLFDAQVVSLVCGQIQIEIVNLLKHDTPVLIGFLVTVLTYFGTDGINLLMPRLFNIPRIEWGDWYFFPICASIFVGLVVGSIMERQILNRILAEGPDPGSPRAAYKPKESVLRAVRMTRKGTERRFGMEVCANICKF